MSVGKAMTAAQPVTFLVVTFSRFGPLAGAQRGLDRQRVQAIFLAQHGEVVAVGATQVQPDAAAISRRSEPAVFARPDGGGLTPGGKTGMPIGARDPVT